MRTTPNYWELAKKEKIIQFIRSILLDLLGGLSISIFILLIDQRWKRSNPEGGFWHRRVRIWEERYRSVDGLDAIFKLLIFFAEISFGEWLQDSAAHPHNMT